MDLEMKCGGEHDSGFALIRVEHVSGEVNVLEHQSGKDTALNFAVRVIKMRSLGHQAEFEPLEGRQGQFGPVVEETVSGVAGIHHKLSFAVELDFPPTQ